LADGKLKMTLNFIFTLLSSSGTRGVESVIICHCHGISDRAIRQAVRGGACTRLEIARSCKAGGVCGGCGPAIDEILASEATAAAAAASPAAARLAATGG
jgi:bacterioferritin-associated ferredoxin